MKHNLIDYFNNIYKLGIPEQLTPNATSILFAILHKLNQIHYPDKICISNTELAALTGCDKATIWRVRPILEKYRYNEIDSNWLIKYHPSGKKHAGFYQLNYALLNRLQIATYNGDMLTESENKLQIATENERQNGNITTNGLQIAMDHIQDKNIQDSSSLDHSTCNKEVSENEKKDEDDFEKAKRIIGKYYSPIPTNFLFDDLVHIGKFSEKQIEDVVKNSKRENVYYQKLPIWIMKGLDDYDVLYGGNGKKPDVKEPEIFTLSDSAFEAAKEEEQRRNARIRAEQEAKREARRVKQ